MKTRLFKHYAKKVQYVNLCDFRVGSCDPRDKSCTPTCHWDDPCQISLHLDMVYFFIRRF